MLNIKDKVKMLEIIKEKKIYQKISNMNDY